MKNIKWISVLTLVVLVSQLGLGSGYDDEGGGGSDFPEESGYPQDFPGEGDYPQGYYASPAVAMPYVPSTVEMVETANENLLKAQVEEAAAIAFTSLFEPEPISKEKAESPEFVAAFQAHYKTSEALKAVVLQKLESANINPQVRKFLKTIFLASDEIITEFFKDPSKLHKNVVKHSAAELATKVEEAQVHLEKALQKGKTEGAKFEEEYLKILKKGEDKFIQIEVKSFFLHHIQHDLLPTLIKKAKNKTLSEKEIKDTLRAGLKAAADNDATLHPKVKEAIKDVLNDDYFMRESLIGMHGDDFRQALATKNFKQIETALKKAEEKNQLERKGAALEKSNKDSLIQHDAFAGFRKGGAKHKEFQEMQVLDPKSILPPDSSPIPSPKQATGASPLKKASTKRSALAALNTNHDSDEEATDLSTFSEEVSEGTQVQNTQTSSGAPLVTTKSGLTQFQTGAIIATVAAALLISGYYLHRYLQKPKHQEKVH